MKYNYLFVLFSILLGTDSDFLWGQHFGQNSLAAHLPHSSSGRRCRWPSQTSHEPPPASQEESLPLNADGSASCAHNLGLDVLKPKKKRYITSLQSVDVLRVHPEELALPVEQPHEVMGQVRLIVSRIQLLGQGKERFWVVVEESDFKYGLSVGEVVLLQVVVKSAARRSGGEKTWWRLHPPPLSQCCLVLIYLKSGMPLGVLIPAPAITTILLQRRSLTFFATSSRVRCPSAAPPPLEKRPRDSCQFVWLWESDKWPNGIIKKNIWIMGIYKTTKIF